MTIGFNLFQHKPKKNGCHSTIAAMVENRRNSFLTVTVMDPTSVHIHPIGIGKQFG